MRTRDIWSLLETEENGAAEAMNDDDLNSYPAASHIVGRSFAMDHN